MERVEGDKPEWRYGEWMNAMGVRSDGPFATVDEVAMMVDLHPYPSYADMWFVGVEELLEGGVERVAGLLREKEWGTREIVEKFKDAAYRLLSVASEKVA